MTPARWIFLCAALSLGFVVLHWRTVGTMSGTFQVEWHRAILAGNGPYPDQYRVLTYGLAEGMIRAGVPFALAYGLLRFVFTAAALYVFSRYLGRWFGTTDCVLGVFMLAWGHPLTAAYEAMQPTDPLNLLLFALALELLASGREWWLVPLVGLGVLNRETVLVIVPLAFIIRRKWPVVLACAAVGAAAYLGPRLVYGLREPYAATSVIHFWRVNLLTWETWAMAVAFLNLALLFAWRGWKSAPPFLRRAAWLAPMLLVIYGSVGYIREIRLLLPVLLATIPLVLCVLDPPTPQALTSPGKPS